MTMHDKKNYLLPITAGTLIMGTFFMISRPATKGRLPSGFLSESEIIEVDGTGPATNHQSGPREFRENPLPASCFTDLQTDQFSAGHWALQGSAPQSQIPVTYYLGATADSTTGITNVQDAHYKIISMQPSCNRSIQQVRHQMQPPTRIAAPHEFHSSEHRPYCNQTAESLSRRYPQAFSCNISPDMHDDFGFFSLFPTAGCSYPSDLEQILIQSSRPTNVFSQQSLSRYTFYLRPISATGRRGSARNTTLYLVKQQDSLITAAYEVLFAQKSQANTSSATEARAGGEEERLNAMLTELTPNGANYPSIIERLQALVIARPEHIPVQQDWYSHDNGESGVYARNILNTSAQALRDHWTNLLNATSLNNLMTQNATSNGTGINMAALGPAASLEDVSPDGLGHRHLSVSFISNRRLTASWMDFIRSYAKIVADFTLRDLILTRADTGAAHERRLQAVSYWWGARRLAMALGCGATSHEVADDTVLEPLVLFQYQQQSCRRPFARQAYDALSASPFDPIKIQEFLTLSSRKERARYFTALSGQILSRLTATARGRTNPAEFLSPALISLLAHEYLTVRAELSSQQILLWNDLIPLTADNDAQSDSGLMTREKSALRALFQRMASATLPTIPSELVQALRWITSLE